MLRSSFEFIPNNVPYTELASPDMLFQGYSLNLDRNLFGNPEYGMVRYGWPSVYGLAFGSENPPPPPSLWHPLCDHWSTDPPGLHCARPRLGSIFSFLKLLNFDFNADLDPASKIVIQIPADPDPLRTLVDTKKMLWFNLLPFQKNCFFNIPYLRVW
jgi:hypothetical protein